MTGNPRAQYFEMLKRRKEIGAQRRGIQSWSFNRHINSVESEQVSGWILPVGSARATLPLSGLKINLINPKSVSRGIGSNAVEHVVAIEDGRQDLVAYRFV